MKTCLWIAYIKYSNMLRKNGKTLIMVFPDSQRASGQTMVMMMMMMMLMMMMMMLMMMMMMMLMMMMMMILYLFHGVVVLIPCWRSSTSGEVARGEISSPIEDRQLNAIRGWLKKKKHIVFLRYSVLGQTSGSVSTNSIAATNGK